MITIIDFMDLIMTNDEVEIEIYSIEKEEPVWDGHYDGFQPRDVIPKKYWEELVDSFQFEDGYICINY